MTTIQTPNSGTRGMHPHEKLSSLLDRTDEPLGFEAGDANLYRYVGNIPTIHIDPIGLALVGIDDPLRDRLHEKHMIIDAAEKWFEKYKNHGSGWPKHDCEEQAKRLYESTKGPWKHWELQLVGGTRFRYVRPPGYTFPRLREAENAVGFFPKSGNACKPFVIDGFHGYHNEYKHQTVYHDMNDFFRKWWMNPIGQPKPPRPIVEPSPIVPPPGFGSDHKIYY